MKTRFTSIFSRAAIVLLMMLLTNISAWAFYDCPHTSLTHHPAVAATCTTAGNTEYWSCNESLCPLKYFSSSNASGSTAIAENSWIIPASHTLTAHPAVAATCTAAGNSAYWECTVCHKYFSDASGEHEINAGSWVIAATGHTLIAHPAVAATCTATGNSAYWECTACHKYFSNAAGTNEIVANSWVIAATGHTLIAHPAVAATCTTAGNSVYWECETCHKYFSDAYGENEITEDSWVIPASHTLTAHEAVAATCTTTGSSAYWECTVCHKYFSDANGEYEIDEDSWITAALGHNIVNGACTRCPIVTAAYKDATGAEQSELAMPLDNTMTTLEAGWYVINSDITYTSGITLGGDVHLILADGCTMNVGTSESRITDGNGINGNSSTNLTIYGQTANSGTLSVYVTSPENNGYDAIAAGGITINGGHIIANVDGDDTAALDAMDSNVTINGGKVEAIGSIGINANDDVIINGGQVTATGGTGDEESGIYTDNGDITLGWTNPTDYIKASNYYAVKVADGKILKYTDGDNTVKLIGNIVDLDDIAGKTLTPYGYGGYCGQDAPSTTDVDESKNLTWEIPLVDDDNNTDTPMTLSTTMTILGTGTMADYRDDTNAPWKEQTVNLILVATEGDYTAHSSKLNDGDKAKLAPNVITVAKNESGWGTYCHGYPVTYSLSEGTAYTISGLSDNNTNVTPTAVDNNVVAPRTPLLLGYTAPDNSNETVTLTVQPTTATTFENTDAIVSATGENGVTFYGNAGTADIAAAAADFIKVNDNDITSYVLRNGVFVQVSQNKGLVAHRCVLNVSTQTGSSAPAMLTIGTETTGITTTNYTNFTNSDGAWYSLDGRKLDKQPTAKGIYINGGRKVVIK